MAIYSEAKTDEEILSELGNVRSVLVLGCSMCANTVYSLIKGLPLRSTSFWDLRAIGTNHEIDRISRVLSRKGVRVRSIPSVLPGCCCSFDKMLFQCIARRSRDVDKIITLCCEAGQLNVGKNALDKQIVGTLNALGLIRIKTYRERGRVFVDKESVSIDRFELRPRPANGVM